ncbi:MAG: hypothetical protein OEW42_00755 [Acidimicrobiia bacterium]|nr:hypothetical protein [Acidimicrobiia bacterium]
MPRSVIYFGLLLFVAYLISLDPNDAGTTANDFFGWVGSMASNGLDFIDSMVEGSKEPAPVQPR